MAKKIDFHVSKASETRDWILEDDLVVICRAWENFEGDLQVFESAVGALLFGRLAGFDALRVVHSWRTLRKYEQILGIAFKDRLRERTADSRRVNGIRYADKFREFWRAIAAGVSAEPEARMAVKS
jgi:hypothetical protein